jgi:prepilin-type processing-associated H-X9-DG protein
MRRIGRFFGEWLAFAVLNGVGAGLISGCITTVCGFIWALAVLGAAGPKGQNPQGFGAVLQAAPEFTVAVLGMISVGFLIGLLVGILIAPFNGRGGLWWCLIAAIGVLFILPSHVITLAPLLFIGLLGTVVPLNFLKQNETWARWDGPMRERLRASWLTSPPPAMRVVGIGLPLLLCLTIDFAQTLSEYRKHSAYVPRIGSRETWNSSRASLRMRNPYARRSNCQSNLKQIMLGVLQYTQDYDEKFPRAPTGKADGVSALIQPYLKSTALFQCRSDFYQYRDGQFSSGDFTDYWFNARFYNLNSENLIYRATSVMWGDGNTGVGEASSAYSLQNLPAPFAPATRHLDGANYAFADGHVKALKLTAISNTAAPEEGKPTFLP